MLPRAGHFILLSCDYERSDLVSAAASFFADILVPAVLFVFEMCMYVLLASVRPWRYLVSSAFRSKVNAQFVSANPLVKLWHLFWGIALLIASLAIVVGLIWFMSHMDHGTKPSPGLREQVIIEYLKHRSGSKQ